MFKSTKFKKFTSILCAMFTMFTMFTFDLKVMCTGFEDDIFDEIPEYHSVLLIGPANSGKTSLKKRLDINTPFVFSNDYDPSIPGIVNYGWADVNKKVIRLIDIAGTADEQYEKAIKGVLRKPPKICLLCLACDELEKNLDYYTRLIKKYDLSSRTFICVTKCDDLISSYIADNLTKIITENGYKNEVLFTSSMINGYKKCLPNSYTGEMKTTITDDMPQDLLILSESEEPMRVAQDKIEESDSQEEKQAASELSRDKLYQLEIVKILHSLIKERKHEISIEDVQKLPTNNKTINAMAEIVRHELKENTDSLSDQELLELYGQENIIVIIEALYDNMSPEMIIESTAVPFKKETEGLLNATRERASDLKSQTKSKKTNNFKAYAGATLITAGIVSTSVILGKLISCKSKNIKNIKANKTPKLEIPKTKKSAKLTT